jgi:hypothetical protein
MIEELGGLRLCMLEDLVGLGINMLEDLGGLRLSMLEDEFSNIQEDFKVKAGQ